MFTSSLFHLLIVINSYCAVPENIHTHPNEDSHKFQGRGVFSVFKLKYDAKVEFQGDVVGVQTKKPSVGGVWLFSGTRHWLSPVDSFFFWFV